MHNKSYEMRCYYRCYYKCEKINYLITITYDTNYRRSVDYESRGQGFKSSRAHHNLSYTLRLKKSCFNKS